MSTQSFRAFLAGAGNWQPRSPWHPVLAVVATIGIIVAGQIAPIVLLAFLSGGDVRLAPSDPASGNSLFEAMEGAGASLLIFGQAALAMLTIGAASLFGGRFAEVLSLERPDSGLRGFLHSLLLMVPVLAIINALAYALSPGGFQSDFAQFAKLAHTPAPLAALLAVAVGAPLWEEMLFRGFLLAPLARPLGFWPAAVVVSGVWTVLHIGYSVAGLAEVFLIGLYFSWLLRRTGSLWVPIACHGLYNAALFGVVRSWPL
ncbi:MAG: CPBP family intramembrane glutamic endopeptidase [Hyphomicrobiaceae bacterium]